MPGLLSPGRPLHCTHTSPESALVRRLHCEHTVVEGVTRCHRTPPTLLSALIDGNQTVTVCPAVIRARWFAAR